MSWAVDGAGGAGCQQQGQHRAVACLVQGEQTQHLLQAGWQWRRREADPDLLPAAACIRRLSLRCLSGAGRFLPVFIGQTFMF